MVKAMLAEVDAPTAVQRMPALPQVFAALNQPARTERVELLKCLNGLPVREIRALVFAYALRSSRRRTCRTISIRGDAHRDISARWGRATIWRRSSRCSLGRAARTSRPGEQATSRHPGRCCRHPSAVPAARSRAAKPRPVAHPDRPAQPAAKSLLVQALVTTIRMTGARRSRNRAPARVPRGPAPPAAAAPLKGTHPLHFEGDASPFTNGPSVTFAARRPHRDAGAVINPALTAGSERMNSIAAVDLSASKITSPTSCPGAPPCGRARMTCPDLAAVDSRSKCALQPHFQYPSRSLPPGIEAPPAGRSHIAHAPGAS